MSMIDFTVAAGKLPEYNFESITGEYFKNNRTLVFCTKTGDEYTRYEIALEIINSPTSDLIDTLDFAICKAPFYSDWSPSSSVEYTALCVRSSANISELNLRISLSTYDQQGNIIEHIDNAVEFFYGLTAGLWRAVWLLDRGSGVPYISEVNLYINTKASTNLSIILLPSNVAVQHVIIGRTYNTSSVITFDASVNGVPVDPSQYYYGDTSVVDGGQGGSFDNTSDSVDFSELPTGGAAASGLITMFAPSAQQMADFGTFLWTTLFNSGFDSLLTSLKKWVNDPIESVIQLAAYPVTPPSGTSTVVKFCGIRSDLVGSGVSMNKCTSQFMDFDFGTLRTPAYWKQALDYSPYSKVSIYLPYIGICPLNIDDVIDAVLHLKYHIDLLTGGFSAELKVSKVINGTSLSSVLYNWSGNMATQIPITSGNFSQVFGSMMTAVAAIGVGAVSGGLGAAAAGTGAEAGASAIASGAISGAGHGLAANIGNVINSKPHVTKSGRLDGTIGAMSQFTPYLIIERPVQSLSSKFQSEQGYPSNVVQTLSSVSGLTVCEAPILDGIICTEAERDMIRTYLTSGVIL